jgi:hypothetical protein
MPKEEKRMLPKLFDRNGKPRTRQWLYNHYGFVYAHAPTAKPDNGARYALVELREAKGNALRVTVIAGSSPIADVKVMLYWPDAPEAPHAGWLQRGVGAKTDRDGVALHILGEGAHYGPPAIGPHSLWIKGANVSPLITGLGIAGGYHLDPTFRKLKPGETADRSPIDEALNYLYSANKHMGTAIDDVAAAITALHFLPNPAPEPPPHVGPA